MTADAKKLDITLRRSGIGCTQRQRETLRGLGLTRIGKTSVRADTVSLRGMLRKVDHLIEVREHGS
ncbi:MAG: 50S ribosomal protein L30 [Deltaproteobacteria bacterium]|nr:50S ribosomal protein L30 [Deltaproteobacteria bacterium]